MMHSITNDRAKTDNGTKYTGIRILAVFFWIAIWQFASMYLKQEILLASPVSVVRKLFELIFSGNFWQSVGFSFVRIVTGVVIANNEFVQDHADKVNDFMDAYKESVDFVNSDTEAAAQIIGDHDIIAKEVAQKAIPDCSIVFIEGDEMKTMLSGYLATLDDQNPEIIGGQLPDDAF